MFAVSYVTIFAFHGDLDIDHVITEHSFGHSREKLTSLNYLTRKQHGFKDNKLLLQLRDCAVAVANKKSKIEISEMFSTEFKFAADCLLKWFNKNFKSDNLELNIDIKEYTKLNIRLTGHEIVVVFVLFLLKLIQCNTMQMRKQCLMLILSFSKNINF